MRLSPNRFFRLRFLPSDRLCRRPALPALILPVPVIRKRFTALRLVFSFGMSLKPFEEPRLLHGAASCVKPWGPRPARGRDGPAAAVVRAAGWPDARV